MIEYISPIVEKVTIDGQEFISETNVSMPIRFLTEKGQKIYVPNDYLIPEDETI